jgi:2-pyrone-4,6-dicarboxylate lactonase
MEKTLPEGACNAHCHVFGPRDRFPYAPDATFIPETDAPKQALYALNDSFGLQRCVVVQSSCHGFDNSATEDAIATRPRDYRGIALLPTDVADAELRRLDAAGFRGVRFNFMAHLGAATPLDEILALARRLAPLNWHLQVHGDPAIVTAVVQTLAAGPVPVVIDHIGRLDASAGMHQPLFQAFCRLLDNPKVWMKVSGMDRISKRGPPYEDAQPFARHLVESFGDRVLWGNDWPHPNHAGPIPDDAQLVQLIAPIAPTAAQQQALLVDNPARLYRFGDL